MCLVLTPYKIHRYSLWTECLILGVKAGFVVLRVEVQVFLLPFLNFILSRGRGHGNLDTGKSGRYLLLHVTDYSRIFEYHGFCPPCKMEESFTLMMMMMMMMMVIIIEFSSLLFFGNYLQINPGLSWW